jgi:S1-C subfamily serine protease
VPVVPKASSLLPSDSTPFTTRGVPSLSAFTGVHSEYHSPRDTADTLNFVGLAEVTRLMAELAAGIAKMPEPPDYVPQTKPKKGGARAGFRAYLGTIPDYAASGIDGLMLSGVASGGPAEEAGLRARDIVKELAGRKIENIYDYTFALEALEIGVEVDVVVERDGETVSLKLVPASRE